MPIQDCKISYEEIEKRDLCEKVKRYNCVKITYKFNETTIHLLFITNNSYIYSSWIARNNYLFIIRHFIYFLSLLFSTFIYFLLFIFDSFSIDIF